MLSGLVAVRSHGFCVGVCLGEVRFGEESVQTWDQLASMARA